MHILQGSRLTDVYSLYYLYIDIILISDIKQFPYIIVDVEFE